MVVVFVVIELDGGLFLFGYGEVVKIECVDDM